MPDDILGMIGRPPVPESTVPWGSAVIDQAALLRDPSLRAHWIPARITGRITPADAVDHPPVALIAVNGVVRLAAWTRTDGGAITFATVLPQRNLLAGENHVDLYILAPGGPPWRCTPVERSDDFDLRRIDTAAGRTVLVMGDGSTIDVDNAFFEGKIDARRKDRDGVVRMGGWSADRQAGTPAEYVVAVLGQRVLTASRPGLARPDVETILGCRTCRPSGFQMAFPAAMLHGALVGAVRVFAIIGLRAVELTPSS
jgi:hypothetical protein